MIRLHRNSDDDDKKPTRYYSKKQEDAVAKAIGGRRVANSGATPFDKGDVRDAQWLIECKTQTEDRASISVKKAWIEKNRQEAIYMGKHYQAVAFSFGPTSENFYIVDENTFTEMKNALEELHKLEEMFK